MRGDNCHAGLSIFVQCLWEPTDLIEVRRLPCKRSTWHAASELVKQAASLERDNRRGQSIYVGANPRKKGGDKDADGVSMAWCLFADWDNATIDEARALWESAGLPEPTIVIASGHGVHAYWRLIEPLTDLKLWTQLQRRLIARVGSDPSVHDPPRIMRLPGYLNCKRQPYVPCVIVSADPARRYALADLERAMGEGVGTLPEPAEEPPAPTIATNGLDVLARAKSYLAKIPGAVEGERNPATYRAACVLVNDFGVADQDAQHLLAHWNQSNRPPLNDQELDTVLANAREYAKRPPGAKLASSNGNGQHAAARSLKAGAEPDGCPEAPFAFERLTSRQLAEREFKVEYIVNDVVPAAQGGLISGRFKTLKTCCAVDLAMSAASGLPFLGRFEVSNPVRAGIMSAESGWPTLKETGQRIARAKGLELGDVQGLVWSTGSPRIGDLEQMDALERFIVEDELGLLLIDPSYLAFANVGDSASNVFKMGGVLLYISRLIEKTGCSIIIVNHNTKGRAKDIGRFDPPDLAEVSMSGFAEWARYWLLLGPRREWAEETGQHWLWLRAGGSAGHAGLFHLDVTEGRRTDPGGRQWTAALCGAAEGTRNEQEQKAADAKRRERETIEDDKRRIMAEFYAVPDRMDTKTNVRDRLGRNHKAFELSFAELLRDRLLVACDVVRPNKRRFGGYKVAHDDEHTDAFGR